MFAKKPQELSNNLTDQVTQTADEAIRSTQRLANEAVDGLAQAMQEVRHQAEPMLKPGLRAGQCTGPAWSEWCPRYVTTLAEEDRDAPLISAVRCIKDEPVKAMLIAVTGAALMALVSLISRSGHRG